MRFLGLKENSFHELVKKYAPDDYFSSDDENKNLTLDK